MRSRDIQEAKLVRAFPIVDPGDLYRIAGIAKTDKLNSLYDPARLHVEAGDNALGKHKFRASLAESREQLKVMAGWVLVATTLLRL